MRTLTTNRREAAFDFGVALGVVLVSLRYIPALTAVFRHLSALAAVLILAAFQFAAEGLVPLILMAIRGERFSDYGFNWRNLGKSIAFAACLVVVYDLALSLQAGKWIWVPLRHHNAVRISFAAGFPLSLLGLAVVIATWGFFEAFFGVFVAKKLNQVVGYVGNGWLAPGVWGFALFNGLLHAAIGQGAAGFLTSFASGYAITVIPAVTTNAWGSSLFQTATNAVGGL
jgi:hypothetical protein